MATFQTTDLTRKLQTDVTDTLNRVEQLTKLDHSKLDQQPEEGKWSVIQILEHLNSYNRYYLPEIEKALQRGRSKGVRANENFSPGWFGDYFTKLMQPSPNGQINKKMKAPKDHTPVKALERDRVIREFVEGQNRLIDFLQQAARTDIGRLKVPISITRFLKLKLGDTFRFLVAHQQRHFAQIEATLKSLSTLPRKVSS